MRQRTTMHSLRRTLASLGATWRWRPLPMALAGFATVDHANSRIGFGYTQMGAGMDGASEKFTAALAFDPARPASRERAANCSSPASTPDRQSQRRVRGKDWFHTCRLPARLQIEPHHRHSARGACNSIAHHQGQDPPSALPSPTRSTAGRAPASWHLPTIKRSDYAIGGEGQWADVGIVADEIRIDFPSSRAVGPATAHSPPRFPKASPNGVQHEKNHRHPYRRPVRSGCRPASPRPEVFGQHPRFPALFPHSHFGFSK